jgi:Glycosyl transferases, related to UDP-glucuronosyltransferase
VRFVGSALGQRLFDIVRPHAFRFHSRPLEVLRRRHGLGSLNHELQRVYTDADFTVYADLPQLVPIVGLPNNHCYIGPTLWSPSASLPDWWHDLPSERPIIYMTLGSSGVSARLPSMLHALANEPVTVIAASANANSMSNVPGNSFVAPFLPGNDAARRAALVVSNGGSLTGYQALASGKPVFGLPANLDQYLNSFYVEAAGAGRQMRCGAFNAKAFARSVRTLLDDDSAKGAAEGLQRAIASGDGCITFDQILNRALNLEKSSAQNRIG